MIKEEWESLLKNKLLLFVVIVIALIPAIYAGFFLASMWDPYGETENLPVAVVNEDKEVAYNDKTLNIGKTLSDSLEKNDSMAFNIVDSKVAEKGLKNGTYYMVITIPKNFSENATTLMNDKPQKMELKYETNPGKNYIAMKMTESAIKEVRKSITAEVTRTYAETMFDSLDEVAEGFEDAIGGTDKLAEGEKKIIKGNNKIKTNLKTLTYSTLTFREGSVTLKEGLSDYLDGVYSAKKGSKQLVSNNKKLNSGTNSVSKGIKQLSVGSTELLKGLNQVKNSLNKSLTKDNVEQINFAATSLGTMNTNIQKLNTAVNGDGKDDKGISLDGLANSLAGVGGNVKKAGEDIGKAAESLVGDYASSNQLGGAGENITKAYGVMATLYAQTDDATAKATLKKAMDMLYNPSDMSDEATALGEVLSATTGISSAGSELTSVGNALTAVNDSGLTDQVNELKNSIEQIATASNQLLPASSNTIKTLLGGLQDVQEGFTQTKAKNGKTGLIEAMSTLKEGITTLDKGVSGKNGLVSGVKSYTKGADKLNKGLSTLVANNEKLSNGVKQLTQGAGQIADGTGKLSEGSSTLGKGLDDLSEGTDALKAGLSNGAEKVKENKANDDILDMFSEPVETKSETITNVENNGHAMAAYMMTVGLWVGSLAFCLMYPLTKYRGKLKSGLLWWASKAAVIYPLSMLMPAALVLALHVFLEFNPENMGLTLLIAVATSVSFMSIMYFFNVLLGKVGSFLMLVFMVIQLAGSAGTYPVEISGPMVPIIHKFVPFTYTVDAFRSAISGGGSVRLELTVLVVLTIVFTSLTVVVFEIRTKRIKEEKPILYQWIEEKGLA